MRVGWTFGKVWHKMRDGKATVCGVQVVAAFTGAAGTDRCKVCFG